MTAKMRRGMKTSIPTRTGVEFCLFHGARRVLTEVEQRCHVAVFDIDWKSVKLDANSTDRECMSHQMSTW